jgi:hypothetical protein
MKDKIKRRGMKENREETEGMEQKQVLLIATRRKDNKGDGDKNI